MNTVVLAVPDTLTLELLGERLGRLGWVTNLSPPSHLVVEGEDGHVYINEPHDRELRHPDMVGCAFAEYARKTERIRLFSLAYSSGHVAQTILACFVDDPAVFVETGWYAVRGDVLARWLGQGGSLRVAPPGSSGSNAPQRA